MPTYTLTITSIEYGDSEKQESLMISESTLNTWVKNNKPLPEIDSAIAYVHVGFSAEPPDDIVCNVEPSKKHVIFRTHRNRQNLDMILSHDPLIKNRFHFLKAVIESLSQKDKGVEVHYMDETTTTPSWVEGHKFEMELPKNPQRIRLVFGMKGKTPAFKYDVYVKDKDGQVEDMPCDPQASNEPPKLDFPVI